eukprot:SAG31_NODE_34683_length_330_cov_1.121212_1_plen_80_part_10
MYVQEEVKQRSIAGKTLRASDISFTAGAKSGETNGGGIMSLIQAAKARDLHEQASAAAAVFQEPTLYPCICFCFCTCKAV